MSVMDAWQASLAWASHTAQTADQWVATLWMVRLWSTLDGLDRMALLAACGAMFGAMCRVWMLDARVHKPAALIHAGAMACTASAAAVGILADGCNLLEATAVVFVLASLQLSWHTWRHGVPEHFDSRPMPLAAKDWSHVSGGKGEP